MKKAPSKYVRLESGSEANVHRTRCYLLLPVLVCMLVVLLLCCLGIQLRIYFLYVRLQKEMETNSDLLQRNNSGNRHLVNDNKGYYTIEDDDDDDLIQEDVTTWALGLTEGLSGSNSTQVTMRPPVFNRSSGVGRGRRDASGTRTRNRNNRRRGSERSRVTTVMHLQLHENRDVAIRQGEKIAHWRLSDDPFNRDQDFASYSNGEVTILKEGVYLIYSQVTFLDHSGRWSYAVTVTENYRPERPFIKCLSTEWGIERSPNGSPPTTFSQCYTSAVTFIRQGELVRIKSMYNTHNIHTDNDMSFWGFVKLA